MATVKHLTTADFEREVAGAMGPVLVDFFATWCPPCRVLAPALERLAAELGERVTIAKVDIDQEPALAARFHVEAVPTLVLFERGRPTRTIQGVPPLPALRALLERAERAA